MESYAELQARLKDERKDKPTVMQEMEQSSEYAVDLDNLPASTPHVWVERGAKVSCEGAMHPHHSHFLTSKR